MEVAESLKHDEPVLITGRLENSFGNAGPYLQEF